MTQRRTTARMRAAAVGLATIATLGLVGMTTGTAHAQDAPAATAKTVAAAGEPTGTSPPVA
ncbi:MAG TPA: hypothetical protein VGO89_22440 [Streptomyces sp.]|nr:hypothetical protein [Streptomyces sp.]